MRNLARVSAFFAVIASAMIVGGDVRSQETPKGVAQASTISASSLAKFSPRARADLVATILDRWEAASTAGIDSSLRIQHFLTQLATETGGLRSIEENLNYSSKRLREIFPKRVTPEQAQRLAYKPVEIANHVYNGRLGNKPPMDGWTYRGSGLIQLTGRANFADRGRELKLPLETQPELARSAEFAFSTAVAYWSARKVNVAADANDLGKVRELINGGRNGLPEANIWMARARRAFGGEKSTSDELFAVQDRLSDLGLLGTKSSEPSEDKLANALKQFQKGRGLPETGLYDEDTLYELTDPANFKGL